MWTVVNEIKLASLEFTTIRFLDWNVAMKTLNTRILISLLFVGMVVSACGGGSSTVSNNPQQSSIAQCVPSDPATASDCGTVIIGLTDADGDFLSYTVDVLSLQLEMVDGRVIEVLPNNTRIDFAQYVDLTEFVTVATVPPGHYVAGKIRLDYTNGEIFVEDSGEAKETIVVDASGSAIGQTELVIELAEQGHLAVSKGHASLLTLDFDLDASHVVDTNPTPALATAEPFITAELDSVDEKVIRIRGELIEINVDEMFYRVALRPFWHGAGDFGRIRVNVTEQTDFEVDEEILVGAAGLQTLQSADEDVLTVAKGTLNIEDREFTADFVLAGSSVPGNGKDAVKGNVTTRVGNELIVRGGKVILNDTDQSFFCDDVAVLVGPNTIVYKSSKSNSSLGAPIQVLGIDKLSVGQAVTIRGEVSTNDETGLMIDATDGTIVMHVTHLSGTVNSAIPGQLDIELRAIDRRRVSIFDFTGTGISQGVDADPENYEISTGDLPTVTGDAIGQPIVVYGFPNDFGTAPPDFEGRTLVDFSGVRSAMEIRWGIEGATAPFLMLDSSGLLLDNQNQDIGHRSHIKQGPTVIDLTTLDSDTLIAPRESGPRLFTIKIAGNVQIYNDFEDFLTVLTEKLNNVNAVRSLYVRGYFDRNTNIFSANKILIHLKEL